MKMQKALVSLLALVFGLASPARASDAPDYDKAGSEAAGILSKYLQIDTTNPPGNERLGAEYLASVLQKNGIEAKVLQTTDDKRACVYARLKGNGKKKAIILLNHIDVVPAQAKDWIHPPFGGEVHDGEIWGRGAQDMKGVGVAELEAMLLIKRQGIQLDRDIIFIGTPDEEVGGECGAGYFQKHYADLVKDAEYLLNEGFGIEVGPDGKPAYWGVDVAEKTVCWLRVTARGDAGHASMPIKDSATNRLVQALARLTTAPEKLTVLPMVQAYFQGIANLAPAELRDDYLNLAKAVQDPEQVKLLMKNKQKAAMLRDTISLTVLKAGYKTNVIPAEASAELDCRLLPTTKQDEFIAHVKDLLGDPSLEVTCIDWQYQHPSPEKSGLFDAIQAVAHEEIPGIPVVPVVVGWATDSHWFRDLGIIGYGFEPFELDAEHLATVHGKNERIPLVVLTNGVKRLHKILLKLST